MIKYVTILNKDEVQLNIMGRIATFTNNQEVTENAYTKAYPMYFKRVGEITGFNSFLAKPMFLADPIEEFLTKEAERNIYIPIKNQSNSSKKIANDNSISEAIKVLLEEDFDVKIEIE